MSDQSDFFADPVTFMQTNVVRCQFVDGSSGIADSKPMVITIRLIDGATVVGSRVGKVFHLSTNTAGMSRAEKMPIFWLGYTENTASRVTLNNTGRMMFTANMDGCTLGIGSQTGDGTCLVSHANMISEGGGEAQRSGQEGQLRGVFGGQGFRMIQPASYALKSTGDSGFKATNFGINNNGTWSFFTHRWMNLAAENEPKIRGRYINGGCKPARPVPPVPV